MPVVLKRWSVPTGEPDNTERVPSGSVGGWGKRSVSYLARSLPNLLTAWCLGRHQDLDLGACERQEAPTVDPAAIRGLAPT